MNNIEKLFHFVGLGNLYYYEKFSLYEPWDIFPPS